LKLKKDVEGFAIIRMSNLMIAVDHFKSQEKT